MIGFETIGNATITVFDDIPVLTTDVGRFVNRTGLRKKSCA